MDLLLSLHLVKAGLHPVETALHFRDLLPQPLELRLQATLACFEPGLGHVDAALHVAHNTVDLYQLLLALGHPRPKATRRDLMADEHALETPPCNVSVLPRRGQVLAQ